MTNTKHIRVSRHRAAACPHCEEFAGCVRCDYTGKVCALWGEFWPCPGERMNRRAEQRRLPTTFETNPIVGASLHGFALA